MSTPPHPVSGGTGGSSGSTPPEQHPPIIVRQLPHQVDVWRSNEDWAGVTSTEERRKLQNRLNQRAYRRRKTVLKNRAAVPQTKPTDTPPGEVSTEQAIATKLNIIRKLSEQAYARYIGRDPRPESLLRLVQLNVFHALQGNSEMLGLSTSWLQCDSVSPFGRPGPPPIGTSICPLTCPDNLRPTALQILVPHHPWIDLLPWPRLRDIVLRLTQDGLIDEDDLCHDLVEFDNDISLSDKAGIIVWGDPWDPRGWEATSAFLRKWRGTVQDCTDILEATNYWREKRGERRLPLSRYTGPETQQARFVDNIRSKPDAMIPQ